MTPVLITKASGEKQPFDESKLRRSLLRSGAPADVIDSAVSQVVARLRPEMTTREIYRLAFGFLKKRGKPLAARYSLKQAIIELGPSGHPFEKLVGEVLKAQGYSVKVAQTVRGKCVSHEVDVVMSRNEERIMVECKFHNSLGVRSNIQCALYVYARFLDLKDTCNLDRPMLVTNTRFSSDAERYSRCMGMDLIGWRTPEGSGLESLATKHRLFPITVLELRRSDQTVLLAHRFIVVDDVLERLTDLRMLLPKDSAKDVESQARELLRG